MAEKSRESQLREVNPVHEYASTPWIRGASLVMPPARSGMDQRWIRFMVGDKEDNTNISRKFREGWTPRKDKDIPADLLPMKMQQGRWAGCIVVEGMLLCERPQSMSARRDQHFETETRRRTEALDADLEQVNRDNKSTAFGPVRKAVDRRLVREVKVQADTTHPDEL